MISTYAHLLRRGSPWSSWATLLHMWWSLWMALHRALVELSTSAVHWGTIPVRSHSPGSSHWPTHISGHTLELRRESKKTK